MPDVKNPYVEDPLIGNIQGKINYIQLGFPNTGNKSNSLCPISLRAVTWPEGRRIDLTWENPSTATYVIIKRSATFHPFLINDSSDILYAGKPINHFIDGKVVDKTLGLPADQQSPADLDVPIPRTGEDLDEDKLYYYSVFITKAEEPYGIFDFGPFARPCMQVTGLSIIDIINRQRSIYDGEYLYKLSPSNSVSLDLKQAQVDGRETGYWQDIARFHQAMPDELRGFIDQIVSTKVFSDGTPGLIGKATDQLNILNNQVKLFGFPTQTLIPDISILRRLAMNSVSIMSKKGTCKGIEEFIKIVTLWDVTCSIFDDNECLISYLKTWDGNATESVVAYPFSMISIQNGMVVLSNNDFVEGQFNGGILFDSMGGKYHIESNTNDTLFLEEQVLIEKEDLLTITVVVPLGGNRYRLTVTRTSGGPALLNSNEYISYTILDSANTMCEVILHDKVNPNLIEVLSLVLPIVGAAAVAPYYIQGVNFAARDPQIILRLFTHCPTFIWEPLMNVTLFSESDPGPFNPLFGGGLLKGNSLIPGDLIIIVKQGVADYIGIITNILSNLLIDNNANFEDDSALINYYVNPNRNQRALFTVESNDITNLNLVSPINSISASDIAKAGNNYFILDIVNAQFYNLLNYWIPLLTDKRFFIFFE